MITNVKQVHRRNERKIGKCNRHENVLNTISLNWVSFFFQGGLKSFSLSCLKVCCLQRFYLEMADLITLTRSEKVQKVVCKFIKCILHKDLNLLLFHNIRMRS